LQIVNCESNFENVGKQVLSGKVVVFPTDTVFGLGSNPKVAEAILRCYAIKKRDREKQVPVLLSHMSFARELVKFNPQSEKLAQTFWPGKLSIVLPARAVNLPKELVGESNTIAVRIPKHWCCKRLIASCGGSLIGTSANLSGSPAFTDSNDKALRDFAGRADFFVQGRCSDDGTPSTVVDMSKPNQVNIVRQGAISADAILSSIGKN
jgi:L-threonylcarbamoyladenylate synthase